MFSDINPGLYIHIPFCASKCPYCAFYSVTDHTLIEKYLQSCLDYISSLPVKNFHTIYIGGGTPSCIPPKYLEKFLSGLKTALISSPEEFTIEANPETASESFCQIVTEHGVNRISLGVQSFDGNILKILGRNHSVRDIELCCEQIHKFSGCKLSLDIMYDIPGVDFNIIKSTLKHCIKMNPCHISAYSYTPETGYLTNKSSHSPFQMDKVAMILENSGYPQYEVSNYAAKENESLHNKKYWKMEDYYGVGAAAHSMVHLSSGNRKRYSFAKNIEEYIQSPGKIEDEVELLDKFEQIKENIIFGLRLLEGVAVKNYEDVPADLMLKAKLLHEKGMLEISDNNIKITKKGLLLLDSVMSYLY